jgi:hypothetical protein
MLRGAQNPTPSNLGQGRSGTICQPPRKFPTRDLGSVSCRFSSIDHPHPAATGALYMSDISTLKDKINTRTFPLFLLGILTGGLYLNVWMYKTFTALEEVTHIKTISPALFVFYLISISSIGYLGLVPHYYALDLIGVLLILCFLLSILWCFRVRRVLRAYALAEHNFELRMNLVYIVLFTFYYVNYCINALPRDKQKHEEKKRLTGQATYV